MPKSAKPIAARVEDGAPLDRRDDSIETPTSSQMTAAPAISENVRGAFSMILSRIGTPEPYEYPSPGQPYLSPVTTFFVNLKYCVYHGLSKREVVANLRDQLGAATCPRSAAPDRRREQVDSANMTARDREDHDDRPHKASNEVEHNR